MPAFFVHGVPATRHLWDPIRSLLSRADVVAVDLPGFGAPVPHGFSATKDAYVDWLIARIEAVGEPVDLVGHDWGAMLALRVASLRPDLVRSWAGGGGGAIDPDYEWHPLAKIWQTPGEGEHYFAAFDRPATIQRLIENGVARDLATEVVDRIDPVMGDAILKLYRSAIDLSRDWHDGLARITAPALVFHGDHDRATPRASADRLAADIRARDILFLDAGHWFPLTCPGRIAAALKRHWRAAD